MTITIFTFITLLIVILFVARIYLKQRVIYSIKDKSELNEYLHNLVKFGGSPSAMRVVSKEGDFSFLISKCISENNKTIFAIEIPLFEWFSKHRDIVEDDLNESNFRFIESSKIVSSGREREFFIIEKLTDVLEINQIISIIYRRCGIKDDTGLEISFFGRI